MSYVIFCILALFICGFSDFRYQDQTPAINSTETLIEETEEIIIKKGEIVSLSLDRNKTGWVIGNTNGTIIHCWANPGQDNIKVEGLSEGFAQITCECPSFKRQIFVHVIKEGDDNDYLF